MVNPETWINLPEEDLAQKRTNSLTDIHKHWRVENQELVNDGKGLYLTTIQNFADFELQLEYKTVPLADSGIYLRGYPQVQIWDTTEAGGKWRFGAEKGSGGLWNNRPGEGWQPLVHADKPFGEWNHFRIIMKGDRVTIYLNQQLVVEDAVLVNYWHKKAKKTEREANEKHNKKFEITIAVLGMMGGAILPFPDLIGWGFVVFTIVNLLSMIFFIRQKMYWLCALSFYFVVVDAIGVWINLIEKHLL